MLILQATVLNVFQTAEFKDKMTGEITPAGSKAQLQYLATVPAGGEKVILDDFNVRDLGDKFKACIGKTVNVQVGLYVDQVSKKSKLFIPKGCLPTIVQPRQG